jgi:hypothetical protein
VIIPDALNPIESALVRRSHLAQRSFSPPYHLKVGLLDVPYQTPLDSWSNVNKALAAVLAYLTVEGRAARLKHSPDKQESL